MNKTTFLTLKLSNVICMLIFTVMAFFIILTKSNSKTKIMGNFSSPIMNKIITIDAGHGGFDPGAIANGVMEKKLNLEISKKLAAFVEEGGGIVVLTRIDDVSTSKNKRNPQKRPDMEERRRMSDKSDSDIFVSIHMNKVADKSKKGGQVFYQPNSEKGKILADSIQRQFNESLFGIYKRKAEKMNRDLFVLKKISAPSVIVECGFISNSCEAENLKTEGYQRKIAWNIYLGLVKYFINVEELNP